MKTEPHKNPLQPNLSESIRQKPPPSPIAQQNLAKASKKSRCCRKSATSASRSWWTSFGHQRRMKIVPVPFHCPWTSLDHEIFWWSSALLDLFDILHASNDSNVFQCIHDYSCVDCVGYAQLLDCPEVLSRWRCTNRDRHLPGDAWSQ